MDLRYTREVDGCTKPYVIYALTDPRSGEARYIGWTMNMRRRLREHVHEAKKHPGSSHRTNWLVSLLRVGLQPDMVVLVDDAAGNWASVERFWIAFFRALGCRLTNGTDGGEGACGLKLSPEARAKMSKSHRGLKQSPEHIANRAAALRGRKQSPEEIATRIAALRGQKHSPGRVAKRAASRKRKHLMDCAEIARRPWFTKASPLTSTILHASPLNAHSRLIPPHS